MPIEIKEIVVKASVNQFLESHNEGEKPGSEEKNELDLNTFESRLNQIREELKEEIMAECMDLVEKFQNNLNRR